MANKNNLFLYSGTVLIIILLFFVFGKFSNKNLGEEEMALILSSSTTKEQSIHLIKLMDKVGPVEAQEMLLKSGLPFTGETHLLIHYVGDYIYDKFGLEGLPLCRDYFLSACYHGFIINALGDHGMDGIVNSMKECDKFGLTVTAQCAHAAGHGFVAWHDYNLVKALETCDTLGEMAKDFSHFNCYDGAFMENVWGVHDGAPSDKRWVKEDDIYYPCTDPRISEKYLNGCWANQATLIYQYNKGDLRKTAEACDRVTNSEYRETCYNNFARQIHPLTAGHLDKFFSLCSNATGKYWQDYCVLTNMNASWSVGDREISFQICELISQDVRNECFDRLVSLITFYYSESPAEKRRLCNKITSIEHKNRCLAI